MFKSIALISILVLVPTLICPKLDGIIKRHEYKVCLRNPNISQNDGRIPFWTVSGDVIPSADRIRLASSLPLQSGIIYCNRMFNADNWQVEFKFRVGSTNVAGRDGMAFWFTKDPIERGQMFGASNRWEGLTVFMDSFSDLWEKDLQLIGSIVNNGSVAYNSKKDGAGQLTSASFQTFRNSPGFCGIRVWYIHKTLYIDFKTGESPASKYQNLCQRPNIELPQSGYFGFSASAGSVNPDDHDLGGFDAHVLIQQSEAIEFDKEINERLRDYHVRAMMMENEKERSHQGEVEDDNKIISDIYGVIGSIEGLSGASKSVLNDEISVIVDKLRKLIGNHKEIEGIVFLSFQDLLDDLKKGFEKENLKHDDILFAVKLLVDHIVSYITSRANLVASDTTVEGEDLNSISSTIRRLRQKITSLERKEDSAILDLMSGHSSRDFERHRTCEILQSNLLNLIDFEESNETSSDPKESDMILAILDSVKLFGLEQCDQKVYAVICLLIVCLILRFLLGIYARSRMYSVPKKHY